MGVSPSFFYWGCAHAILLYFMGTWPISRPSFFLRCPCSSFFWMGVSRRPFLLFFTGKKSLWRTALSKLISQFFTHLFLHVNFFFHGYKIDFTGKTLNFCKFLPPQKQYSIRNFCKPFLAHIFFLGAPILFNKKEWALFFWRPFFCHLFFYLAHLSLIPIY